MDRIDEYVGPLYESIDMTKIDPKDQLQFDISWGLAFLTPTETLPLRLPNQLSLSSQAKQFLEDCTVVDSFKRSSCRITSDLPALDKYALTIGSDALKLYPGGEIRAGGSGINIQLHDPSLNRKFAFKIPRVSVFAYQEPDLTELDRDHFVDRFQQEYRAFQNERHISRRLSHENVVQHIYGGYKTLEVGDGVTANISVQRLGVDRWRKAPP